MPYFRKYNKLICKISVVVLAFILGTTFGWLLFNLKITDSAKSCRSGYKFINPEPGCEISEKEDLDNIYKSSGKINDFIEKAIRNNKADSVSVFFRDLVTRRWFGINENESYKAGSLLKLPLLIAYYKFAEIDKGVLSKRFQYLGENESRNLEDIKSGASLKHGKDYSVSELIDKMIIDSDNDSAMFLFNKLDPKFRDDIYIDLGIYNPTSEGIDKSFVSARNYGSLFRILYNASYLSRELSDKALELMSKAVFKNGLVAGVPNDIVVSHKFSEKTLLDENNNVISRTMNDCGIVYAPSHPYIICVATNGKDFKNLEGVIKNISEIVYDELTN